MYRKICVTHEKCRFLSKSPKYAVTVAAHLSFLSFLVFFFFLQPTVCLRLSQQQRLVSGVGSASGDVVGGVL